MTTSNWPPSAGSLWLLDRSLVGAGDALEQDGSKFVAGEPPSTGDSIGDAREPLDGQQNCANTGAED